MAHPFWDAYLEFEERIEAHAQIFEILARIIRIPMHQYAKYFDRFHKLSQQRAVKDIVPSEYFAQWKAEFEMNNGANQPEAQIEAALRPRAEAHHADTFRHTQEEVNKRWGFEQHIKRPYFHVTEVDEEQLDLWRRYLDFEEQQRDNERIVFLYERCLVALAYYDDFWLRYVRWQLNQRNKSEEVRHIYMRASCFYTAIARPAIRLQWALFEEREGRPQIAADIYSAILDQVPDMTAAISAWANLERRLNGIDAAVQIYNQHISSPATSPATKAELVSSWAKLLWQYKGAPDEARQLLQQSQGRFMDSKIFFATWLDLEIGQHGSQEDEQRDRIKKVVDDVRKRSQLSKDDQKELCGVYMQWLVDRGTKDVASEWLKLDGLVNA